MANLHLGQDVATKRKKIDSCSYSGQNIIPYRKIHEYVLTVLLLTSIPLFE